MADAARRRAHQTSLLSFVAVAFSALALTALLSGCGGKPNDEGAGANRPFEGATVRVVTPPGLNLQPKWQNLLDEWSARTGARAELAEADPLRAEDADVLVFPLERLPELAAAGRLAPMPAPAQSDQTGLRWSDVPRGLAANVLSIGRQPVAAPFGCPVLALYYRKDLLAAANRSPPTTWDEYQKLLETVESWAPGLVVVEPWHPDVRAAMFLARSLSYSRHPSQFSVLFDIETGAPLLDSPGWERGLEVSLAALKRMPPETLEYTPADCRRLILEGRAAMAVAYETPAAADFDAPAAGAASSTAVARGDGVSLGVARLPGSRTRYDRSTRAWEDTSAPWRVDLAGFRGLAAGVSSSSAPLSAQAAWNLLATLTDPGVPAVAFPDAQRSICRKSQVDEGRLWHGAELTDAEGRQFLQASVEALSDAALTFAFPVPSGDEFARELSAGLEPALRGEAPPREALAAVQAKWTALVERIGPDKVRDGCRRQIGLPALGRNGPPVR